MHHARTNYSPCTHHAFTVHHAPCVYHAGRALSLVVAAVLLGAFVGSAVEGWVRVDLFPLGVSIAIAIMGYWVQHCDHWKQQ